MRARTARVALKSSFEHLLPLLAFAQLLLAPSVPTAAAMVTNADSCTTNVAGETCCGVNRTKSLWTASALVNFSDHETCVGECCR